jgi:hypothetical protein
LTREALKLGAVWANAQAMPERRAAARVAACMILLARLFRAEVKPKARPDIPRPPWAALMGHLSFRSSGLKLLIRIGLELNE